MPRTLPRTVPLAELHCHLGAAVTPAIMWGIAHAQGIKLPTKDYWEFRELITVGPKGSKSFDRRTLGLRGGGRGVSEEQHHDDGAPL